jgi:hypothetical protein
MDPKPVLGTKKGVPVQIAIHLAFVPLFLRKSLVNAPTRANVVADMIRYTATHAS